jgi:hypothetical protein
MNRRTTLSTSRSTDRPGEHCAERTAEPTAARSPRRPARDHGGAHRSRSALVRPAVLLAAAACGAVLVNVLTPAGPVARAGTTAGAEKPLSVAAQLGLTASTSTPSAAALRPLRDLSASRAMRSDSGAATLAGTPADQGTLQSLAQAGQVQQQAVEQAQAEAAAKAAAEAAAQAAAQAAAAAAAATPSSFQQYALQKLGGDQGQFSCLQNLWGKESGWNPNAHNPSSSAYGIPQFLDSTWASTGIARTSDGYRQIDAGLVYIDSRYGSPCGAWSHSRADNWY